MIKAAELARTFEEIIGWPYVSPGTNDQNGIDCSGAFVRGYRKHGRNIAHGSNTIFRKHCSATGLINGDVSRLFVGMAVFKHRNDGKEPDKYKKDGLGNMYHIGLVTSTGPLRIVHATEPKAKVDTSLGKDDSAWDYYGWLDDVDYSGESIQIDISMIPRMTEEEYLQEPLVLENIQAYVKVITSDGRPVKIREKHNISIYKYKAPVGTVMPCKGIWSKDKQYYKVIYRGSERLVKRECVVSCDAQGNAG